MAITEPNIRPQFWCFFTRNISAQWDTPVFKVSSNKIHVFFPPRNCVPEISHTFSPSSHGHPGDRLRHPGRKRPELVRHHQTSGSWDDRGWVSLWHVANNASGPQTEPRGIPVWKLHLHQVVFWPNFPLRKILLIFLFFKQTKCICVSLREHVSGKHESTRRGLFNLTRSDNVIPILVLLMIGLQIRWHLLRPSRLRLKTFIHVLFIPSPCFSFAISMWPCFPLLWHDRL